MDNIVYPDKKPVPYKALFPEPRIEQWKGQYAFLHGAVLKIGIASGPDDPDDGPDAPLALELEVVPTIAPRDDEVDLFKAIWTLSDSAQRRGESIASRTEIALGAVLALHESHYHQLTRVKVTLDPRRSEPSFTPRVWSDIANALEATAQRTYQVHGAAAVIQRLNDAANSVRFFLSSLGRNPNEGRDDMIRLERDLAFSEEMGDDDAE